MKSLSEEDFYDVTDENFENKIEVGGLKEIERRQLQQAMKESRKIAWRRSAEGYTRDVGGSSS